MLEVKGGRDRAPPDVRAHGEAPSSNQTIIVCPARAATKPAGSSSPSSGRRERTAPSRPRRSTTGSVAVVQGLTHFVTLCMADTVRRLGVDLHKTLTVREPGVPDRALARGQAPLPGPGALCRHPPAEPVRARGPRGLPGFGCRALVHRRFPAIPARFRKFFGQNSRHLGAYCDEGQKITDALIECMVNR